MLRYRVQTIRYGFLWLFTKQVVVVQIKASTREIDIDMPWNTYWRDARIGELTVQERK